MSESSHQILTYEDSPRAVRVIAVKSINSRRLYIGAKLIIYMETLPYLKHKYCTELNS